MEVYLQYNDKKFYPASKDDIEKTGKLLDHQIVKTKITIPGDQQIARELALYWKLCKIVAEHTVNKGWETPAKVDLHIRSALKFFDEKNIIQIKNILVISPYSISTSNIKKIKQFDYFQKAFKLMALHMGCTINELKNIGYRH